MTTAHFDHEFSFDRFQIEAMAAIDRNENTLVAAPTGSGKTVIAEHAVEAALNAGGRCFYTAPIKALSNQKYNDLVAVLGVEKVGLLTGDHALNGEAPVVVMTTEVLRNMVYSESTALDDLSWVVLDEVHFLSDAYRGPVWEEVLIHTPSKVNFVCLSATVSNATELGEWIGELRGITTTVVEHTRPIELEAHLLVGDHSSTEERLVALLEDGRPNPAGHRFDVDRPSGPPGQRHRPRSRFYTPRRVECVEMLAEAELLPAIYFIFSRNGCDEAVNRCFDAGVRLTTSDERSQVRALVEARTSGLNDSDLNALGYDRWVQSMENGIASHHAGMIPAFREAVEACFVAGLIKITFATETLALGINMPARSVVIEKLSKFTGVRHEFLTPGQFTQLTGRAGRRGIDDEGHAIVLWSPFTPFKQIAELAASKDFPLSSSFRPTYNMAANLMNRYGPTEAFEFVSRSFAQFQADRAVVGMKARADRLRQEISVLDDSPERASEAVFDIAGYAAVVDELRSSRTRSSQDLAAINQSLRQLKPGDVLNRQSPKGLQRLVVLSVSTRKGGSVRLRCVDTNAKTVNLDASNAGRELTSLARIELPVPYEPKNPEFRRESAKRLKRFNPKRHKPKSQHSGPARDAGTGGDRPSILIDEMHNHPLHDHPDREALLRNHQNGQQLQRQLDELEAATTKRGSALLTRFEAVVAMLQESGHMSGWQLTDAGRRLGGIYHELDLLISLALTAGLFDGLDAPELAAFISCFTHEHRSSEPAEDPVWPTREVGVRFSRLIQIWKQTTKSERFLKLPESREPQGGFASSAWSWAAGHELDLILDGETSGGDFVRNIRQLVDVLGQIDKMAIQPETARAARSAAGSLRRGVVMAADGLG